MFHRTSLLVLVGGGKEPFDSPNKGDCHFSRPFLCPSIHPHPYQPHTPNVDLSLSVLHLFPSPTTSPVFWTVSQHRSIVTVASQKEEEKNPSPPLIPSVRGVRSESETPHALTRPLTSGTLGAAVLWDDAHCRVVGYVELRLPILRVLRRKDLLFMATTSAVYTYKLAIVDGAVRDPPLLLHEADVGDNPRGLFCAHYAPVTSLIRLVHPTTGPGHVCVTSFSAAVLSTKPATTSKPPSLIEAHRHPLRSLALGGSGTKLATASDSGTVVKIFDLVSGGLLHVFRAQLLSSDIDSISFNRAESLVCATFALTLHVFKLAKPAVSKEKSYVEWVSTYVPLPQIEGVPSSAQTRLPGNSSCVFLPDGASALAVCINGSALRFRLMLPDAKLQLSEFHKLHRRDEQSDFFKMLDYA